MATTKTKIKWLVRQNNAEHVTYTDAQGNSCALMENPNRIAACLHKLDGHDDLSAVQVCPKGTLEILRKLANAVDSLKKMGAFSHGNDVADPAEAARIILAIADAKGWNKS